MPGKPIQEQLGERLIQSVADFARADLDSPEKLQAGRFAHVSDTKMREALARVFYGARWIYKLGLVLLTRGEERAAHVRAQIVDYAAVCEGLLSDSIAHAVANGHTVGDSHNWQDPDFKKKKVNWSGRRPEAVLQRSSLWWLIRVSKDFGIIDGPLAVELDWLRKHRNTVHLRQQTELGQQAYLNHSKQAFEIAAGTIGQTRAWKSMHR